ncbi:MAG: hypothetical protein B7Z66_06225 [Chromatiales bacterium 21-64-14]|nr:MAG: hypothetical protein B7Z66_06225 [Chromatiales bacterium 21-64-14]HQU15890.1 protein phosphatase 2C domain-containing protein [Gammaproteobacteria bacterium]
MANSRIDEAVIYVDQDMGRGQIHSIAHGVAGVFSVRAPDKDTSNEDSAGLIPYDDGAAVLVVADGVGGMPAGEQASRLAVEAIRDAVHRARAQGGELRDAVMNGIEDANQAVCAMGIGAATTLAVVEIQGCTVRTYHVGDSMILVVGQRGRIKLQTVSHSPVGYGIEAGLLNESEAMHHEERHLVLNTIGSPDMRIEVGSTAILAPRDTLLVATDGAFDNLQTEEIVECIRIGSMRKAIGRLASGCRARMMNPGAGRPSKPDDLTFIAFRCGPLAR